MHETGTWGHYAILFSPFDLLNGTTRAIFDVTPDTGSTLEVADLPALLYPVVAAGFTLLGAGIVLRRYERIAA